MHVRFLIILFLSIPGSISHVHGEPNDKSFVWGNFYKQPQQAQYIAKRFQGWRGKNSGISSKPLRVVYFHPKDREPLRDHKIRWNGILTDIQNFFRTEMTRLGYKKITLSVEREDGKLKLHEVRGMKNDSNYTYKSGGEIREEVFNNLQKKKINPNQETLLIVCGLSKTEGKKVTIYSPYYGMGADHNRGICFTADMEWLSVEGLKFDPKKITLQVKEHRGFEPFTLGRFNTVYIGGTIHELGHGLSLPHNLATLKESIYGTALMGAGNYTYRKEWRKQGKGSFLTHSSALRLLVHPLFSGTSDLTKVLPNLTYEKIKVFEIDGVIRIQGKISSEIPTIAMVAYNDRENKGQRGYMVNNNYDATSWTSVLNQDNEFQINIEDLRDGNHQIRLLSIHANGATETKRMHYSIEDGKPNFAQAQKEIDNILAN